MIAAASMGRNLRAGFKGTVGFQLFNISIREKSEITLLRYLAVDFE